jgi:hypothetical protein
MEAFELTIVTGDNAATGRLVVPAQAGVAIGTGSRDAVERALAAAARDAARLGDLLDAVSQARLWVPLPGDGRRATDGSAVHLPTVRYLGEAFVPAYTSAARLLRAGPEPAPGERAAVLPHVVVAAADLARRLPPGIGIALNPGADLSVPVYPAGVAHLAAEHAVVAGRRVRVGPLPVTPAGLLGAIAAGLGGVRQAREAAAAWLAVERAGEGLVIAVTLDDPAAAQARDAAYQGVAAGVREAAGDAAWPVDVTFPGEGEPDVIDRWVASFGTPFYRRSVGLPAPRPASP